MLKELLPNNYDFVWTECDAILSCKDFRKIEKRNDMSDQVDDYIERYEKWDEQWTQTGLFILKDKNIVPYEIKEKKVILCVRA